MKNLFIGFFFVALSTIGQSINSQAQIFDIINSAVETVNRANNTYNNARNTYNEVEKNFTSSQNNTPSYEVVGSVTLVYKSSYGTARGSAQIVEYPNGDKKIKVGGSVYTYYENSSYDPSESDYPYCYEYYVNVSGTRKYFNM